MNTDWEKLRTFKRIFFSKRKPVKGRLKIDHAPIGTLDIQILDLSAGGLGCFYVRNPIFALNKRDCLMLLGIDGEPGLSEIANIGIEIKWVLDTPALGNIGFGCQFIDLTPETRGILDGFVKQFKA